MGMSIDKAIEKLSASVLIIGPEDWDEARHKLISMARKYQKIQEILNSTSYIENDTVYSYTYDEDTRVKHIREVLEDGDN